MLYTNTVSEETLVMIERLMRDPKLNDFYLVGGTSLSLRLGHRMSIDIDLFTTVKFDKVAMKKYLDEKLDPDLNDIRSNGLAVTCGRENIDLWYYPAKAIGQTEIIDRIRMLSVEDVCAMKMNSIAFGNYRPKDYIDIYYSLERKSLSELTEAYTGKYPDLPAKKHVKCIDSVGEVKSIKLEVFDKKLTWDKIEKRIKQSLLFPKKVFKSGVSKSRGMNK